MKLREQGVALLVVLLILSLMVTIAAVIAERNGRTFLRTVAQLDQLQAKWDGYTAETIAKQILQRSRQESPGKRIWHKIGRSQNDSLRPEGEMCGGRSWMRRPVLILMLLIMEWWI